MFKAEGLSLDVGAVKVAIFLLPDSQILTDGRLHAIPSPQDAIESFPGAHIRRDDERRALLTDQLLQPPPGVQGLFPAFSCEVQRVVGHARSDGAHDIRLRLPVTDEDQSLRPALGLLLPEDAFPFFSRKRRWIRERSHLPCEILSVWLEALLLVTVIIIVIIIVIIPDLLVPRLLGWLICRLQLPNLNDIHANGGKVVIAEVLYILQL
mmetsp:Transcript_71006/g.114521  ORF Transcript_71006/g.114521 Transcript_71006/m.114521 type:complete len:209 (+) Transcript_71006:2-628(+)